MMRSCMRSTSCPPTCPLQDRGRQHSSPEAELDLDPNALLETDAHARTSIPTPLLYVHLRLLLYLAVPSLT
jgi:hypothetical protein